ncbi:unnamed protein product [Menidia menidia]|uniref:(Atlantic silverside) hypothetical protein n=1 Tax=Menidia menidia TaxID=238744 RepID=A0A8S4AVJ0_9TELE|nr:unnamed protein product [Menidia menidia]
MASTWVSMPGTTCTSKILFLLFSALLPRGPLVGECGPISGSHQRLRPAVGLGDGHGGVLDPSLLEQENSVDAQSVLENLKEQFLRTFNLSGLGPPAAGPGSSREEPPEYMMELYNRFANDRTAMPTANIIRSFKNEDSNPSAVGVGGVRRHPLLFNVSVPGHERVTAAELRLYTLVQTDRHLYAGVDRKVTVYELESHDRAGNASEERPAGGGSPAGAGGRLELLELASRQVYGTDNGWEAFDLTAAVRRWRGAEGATTHRLEVHISSISEDDGPGGAGDPQEGIPPEGDMEIDNSQEDRHQPLLIVFSDDQSNDHRNDRRELNEMIDHETADPALHNDVGLGLDGPWGDEGDPDEEDLIQMRSNLIYDTASRIRRNAKGNHCKRQSLYVEFKDIGWDSWILAPTGYDAFECAGICSYPLTKHVTPTKHAIVQTLVNINSPQKAARACCVPTKLDPISLLYLDDTGVVTYKYKYEGMVVAECGCR